MKSSETKGYQVIDAVQERRGGVRLGSGRKPKTVHQAEAWLRAHNLPPLTAAEVLSNSNERQIWRRLLRSEDEAIVLGAMKFLVMMRDGKPAQQINITQQTLTLSVDEIAKAKQIIAEIRGTPYLLASESLDSQTENQPADISEHDTLDNGALASEGLETSASANGLQAMSDKTGIAHSNVDVSPAVRHEEKVNIMLGEHEGGKKDG